MAVNILQAAATVASVAGKAWIRRPDGTLQALKPGDRLAEGQMVVTTDDAILTLNGTHGESIALGVGAPDAPDIDDGDAEEAAPLSPDALSDETGAAIDRVIHSLETDDPPSSGLNLGDAQEGHSFVRLGRVAEGTDPAHFHAHTGSLPQATEPEAEQIPAPPPVSVDLTHDAHSDTGTSVVDSLTGNAHPLLQGLTQPGATVTLTLTDPFAGVVVYVTQADAAGKWTLDLASAVPVSGHLPSSGLHDGEIAVTAVARAGFGAGDPASTHFTVDTVAPVTHIGLEHTNTSDTGISAVDSLTRNARPVITGSGEPNSTVSVTLTDSQGHPLAYTAQTDNTGHWSIDLAAQTPTSGSLPVGGLPDGTVALTVSSSDKAGNSSTAHGSFMVDTQATASISLDPITADNTVNAAESQGTLPVTGTVGGDVKAGDVVTLELGGQTYTGTVASDGQHFTINVPGSVLAGQNTLSASVTGQDNAGNTATASTGLSYAVDTRANASISIDAITADNSIDSAEAATVVAVTGTVGGDAKSGDTVVLNIGGSVYTGTVAGDGVHYSINVPGAMLASNNQVNAQITVHDAAGNTASASADRSYAVNLLPTAAISINPVTADNIVNAAEAAAPILITGSVGGDVKAGDTVTLTVGGNTYSGSVTAGHTFSIAVPGAQIAAQTLVSASVTTFDNAGHSATANSTRGYAVDNGASAAITVDPITADNVVNGAEAAGTIAVTGTVGGDARVGDTVTLTVGANTYTGGVLAGNTYSINVPGAVLAANVSVQASISVTDAAGNTANASANHPYTSVLSAAASIAVDAITADNVINAAEASGNIAVTGTVGGVVQPGDTVTLVVDSQTYTGTVQAGNTFSISIPGSVLIADTTVAASVTGHDAFGNPATATDNHAYTADTVANAAISIDPITADNVINATEAIATIAVTGTVGGDGKPGDTVTLTVGGNTYTGTVQAGNLYSINVPGSDLAANSSVHASVTVTDTAGNTATANDSHAYSSVLAATASIAVDPVTADNIINATEAAGVIAITGTVGGVAQAGDPITLSVGGNPYSGFVQAGNTFSINIPGAVLAANAAINASVIGHDTFGNVAVGNDIHAYTVDTLANASITVNAITVDNVINAAEAAGLVAVTGSVGGDARTGDALTLTVNGNTYTGTVQAGNTYSINVLGSDLAATTSVSVSVTAHDAAGNTATATANHAYTVDLAAAASITIDPITADNVVNAAEAASSIAVTGTVGGDAKPGDFVTLTVGGNVYIGAVQAGNTFSISIPGSELAANANVHGSVSVTDPAGNTASASTNHPYASVLGAVASIVIDPVTADNVVNATEAAGAVAITGTVGGVAQPGDTVTLTVGGNTYTGTVQAGNTFSINVPGAVLAANATVDASVTGHDAFGNAATGNDTHPYSVDTTIAASISIDAVTADNVINAAEAAGTVAVTGTVGGDVATGDTVTLTVGGNTYTGTVQAGNTYSINVPGAVLAANANVSASVTTHDAAGNAATASANHAYTVDVAAAATITIDSVTADNIVNATEAAGTIAITGTVGGDAKAGDTVTLTIGGNTYAGSVSADGVHYSITVPGATLAANALVTASITTHDVAGNAATASANQPYTVDTVATASVTVDAVTADNIINAAEAATANIAVTGTVGGDATTGDTVTLTVGGNTYTGTVQAGNTYSINVPGAVLAANASVGASVTAHDAAGNAATGTTSHGYTVDLAATASITVDPVTADNIINATEAAGTVAITGTVGGDATTGDTVTLTIGGNTFTGTVQAGNTYSINVSGAVLAANANIDASVTAHDAAGNTVIATTSHGYPVDTTATASITVDAVTADNVINATEAAGTVAITGTVGGDAVVGDTVTLTVGANTYTGTVQAGNTYSINVPGAVLAANTSIGASITAHDAAGNAATATATHNHTVDLAAAASITVDSVTADNIINATEAAGTVAITGTVGGDAQTGDTVTLTIGGNTFIGAVQAGNTYSINVSGAVLAAHANVDASVTTHDAAGNAATATTSHGYTVDTVAAASITVNAVTADNIINATEAATANIAVTGTVGGDATTGDTVTLTVGGNTYTGTVQAGNTYSINVPGAVLAANASINASVTAHDAAGNSATGTANHLYTVDTVAIATITVDPVTADNIINGAEAAGPVSVTGTVGGDAQPGDTVTLTVGGNAYTGTVQAGNTYSIDVPGAVLANNGNVHASVGVTDAAGNTATGSTDHAYSSLLGSTATITVDPITADNIVNATEAGATIAVTGSVGGVVQPGDPVTLTVGGNTYSGTVLAGNTFSINVPGAVLAVNNTVDASVTGHDVASNPATGTDSHNYAVDLVATASVTVNAVTADNIINATESALANIAITGTVGGDAKAGDTVTLTIGGNTYTGTVQAGNTYSINVPGAVLAANTGIDASVTAHDAAGNVATGTVTHNHTVDLVATASIAVDAVTADNVINAAESASTIAITGTVGGDAKTGDTVTLTIGGNTYTGAVQAGNTYSINVSGAVLAANTSIGASVTAHDAAGNAATGTTTHNHTVDLVAAASITVNSVTADNIINATEAAGTVAVTGTVGGDATTGDTVALTIGGNTYTGTVQAGNTYSINVPGAVLAANTSIGASVTAHDAAGNAATGTATHTHTVDLVATASITVNSVTADNIINATEAAGTVAVTGTVGGDATTGDTVTLTIGGNTYTDTVQAGNTYSINVPGAVLAANTSIGASVTAHDAAGNAATGTVTHNHTVDLVATASVTVDAVTADNIVNATESALANIAITGTVGGDAKAGDTVTLTIGGNTYTGTVQAGNTYSINVPGAVLAANTSIGASVTAQDAAGNTATGTATHNHTVDLVAAASITVNSVTADNIINAAEAAGTVAVTGTVGGDATTGDTVTLTIGGNTYTGTVQAGNTYSINVAGAVLAANTSIGASVTAHDAAGNAATGTATHNHTVDLVAAASITVNSVTADNIINATEAAGTVAVTGTVGGDATTGDTVTLTIGGNTYTGAVQAGNTYSINVSGAVLAANTSIGASVTAHDAAGNAATGTATHNHTVDLVATASITVNSVTADNIINATEAAGTVAVTGTVGGDATTGDTVTLTIGGNTYTGTVQAGNTYSINVSGAALAANTSVGASVTAHDAAGNAATATANRAYTVDTVATASITVDAVTADNVINASEATATIAITGTVGGDAKAGDTVTLTIGGNTYAGTVQAGNTYSINVPGATLAANSAVGASVTAHDAAGNAATATANHAYVVDTAVAIAITNNGTNGDGIYNKTESAAVVVSGTTDAENGRTVTITFSDGAGHTVTDTATVSNGTWTISSTPANLATLNDGALTVTAAVTDAAGNSASAVIHPSLDTVTTAVITENAVTADNIVNVTESTQTITLTGSVSGDVAQGDTVTLSVGGATYTGTLNASLQYSINVSGSALAANSSVGASILAHDAAGNTATMTATKAYTVDPTPTLTALATSGLRGEFYGYNDSAFTDAQKRSHSDDTTVGNLDAVSDLVTIINGRQGSSIVGTNAEASNSAADAKFWVTNFDYGTLSNISTNLGATRYYNTGATIYDGNPYFFLNGSSASGDAHSVTVTTALGKTTDAMIRVDGSIFLAAGAYDVRVTGDDGYQLRLDGTVVNAAAYNHTSLATTVTGVNVADGMHALEVLYWDQGVYANLKVEIKASSSSTWETLTTGNFALTSASTAPTLADNQDVIYSGGTWNVRTGLDITGTSGAENIVGGAGRDVLAGGGGGDTIRGGQGNDSLTGGTGSDTFVWKLNDDVTPTGIAAHDVVTNFSTATQAAGGDVLDLRDLLTGESHATLTNYLHFSHVGSDTQIDIKATGSGSATQIILLQGIDLTVGGTLTDAQIISDLFTKSKLVTD